MFSKSSLILQKFTRNVGCEARTLASTNGIRFASTLVISDPLTDNGETPAPTQAAVTAASKFGQAVDLLVVSSTKPSKVPDGVTNVYHVECGDRLAETIAGKNIFCFFLYANVATLTNLTTPDFLMTCRRCVCSISTISCHSQGLQYRCRH